MSDIGVALSVLSNLQARSIQAERWYSSIGTPTERSRGALELRVSGLRKCVSRIKFIPSNRDSY